VGHNSELGTPRAFIPSGVPELNEVLDREGRGWPVGRIIELYGGEATAKSGIAYALLAETQKAGGVAALYPSEGNYDEWLAIQYGIDLDSLILADNETVEGIFGSFRQGLRQIGKNGLFVAVIDSIAGMSTEAELADEELRRDRSAQIRALMISSALRKIGAMIPRTNAILFCVNQLRDAVDVQFGQKSKPPGGRALKFYASIRLRLESLGKVTRTRAGKKYVTGFQVRITAEKNRLARPYQTADIYVDYEQGLRSLKEFKKDTHKKKRKK